LRLSLAWIFEEEALARLLTLHDVAMMVSVATLVTDILAMAVTHRLLDIEVVGATTITTPINHNAKSASSTVIMPTNVGIGMTKTMCLSRGTLFP
jgi:hypothetical protein